uniref:ubiquitinyl hydrolase 1 n=1 Tax=Schistocephalus solidus TaxID=70667 RepID=A0A0X3PIB5_SCHSO
MVSKKRLSRQDTEKTKKGTSVPPPKGLRNLGNTCYLNSALQCICRVSALRHLLSSLLEKEFSASLKHLNDDGSIDSLQLFVPSLHSPLTRAYIAFIDDMHEVTRQMISPAPLRDLLVRQYHRFEGFDQQDSHEVLRCLLDGLRQEEVKRWQKAVLTALKINPKDADEKAKAKVKAWGRSLNLCTAVDRIFGGVLLTSLTCCECNTVLSNFEIFLDLSLPIVEESTRNPPLHASSVSGPKRDQSVEKTPKSKRELKRERKAKAKQTRPKRKNKYSNFKGQGNIDSDFDDIVDVDTPPPDEADDIKVEVVQLPPEAEVRAPSASPENSTDGVLAAVANLPASGKEPTVAKTEEEAAMTWATTSYSPNSGQTEVLYDDLEITRRRIELLADAQNDFTVQESDVFEFKSAQSNPVSPIVPEDMESSFIVLSPASSERIGDGIAGECRWNISSCLHLFPSVAGTIRIV